MTGFATIEAGASPAIGPAAATTLWRIAFARLPPISPRMTHAYHMAGLSTVVAGAASISRFPGVWTVTRLGRVSGAVEGQRVA